MNNELNVAEYMATEPCPDAFHYMTESLQRSQFLTMTGRPSPYTMSKKEKAAMGKLVESTSNV